MKANLLMKLTDTNSENAMNNIIRSVSMCLILVFSPWLQADVEVFKLRGGNPQHVLETVRSSMGDRVNADIVQSQLVVVGDAKAISDVTMLLSKIDRLPLNLRLTLSEIRPPQNQNTGDTFFSTAPSPLVVDTLEGTQVSLDYEKLHQQVKADGWIFTVNDEPVAVKQLVLRVSLVNRHTAEISESFTRYENNERKVFGRIVLGEMGTWIPLLPEQGSVSISEPNKESTTEYSSSPKPGEQLYLKVEKVLVPTKRH